MTRGALTLLHLEDELLEGSLLGGGVADGLDVVLQVHHLQVDQHPQREVRVLAQLPPHDLVDQCEVVLLQRRVAQARDDAAGPLCRGASWEVGAFRSDTGITKMPVQMLVEHGHSFVKLRSYQIVFWAGYLS